MYCELTLDDAGPSFLPLIGRSLFDARGDGPHMPRRIDNPPGAVAPELVLHREEDLRTSGHGPLDHFVHVFDIDIDHHRRAAVRLRSTARKGWPLSFDHDHSPADRKRSMCHGPVGTGSAHQFHGIKRGLAEVNFGRRVAAHQHRHHNWDAVGYRFHFAHNSIFPIFKYSLRSTLRSTLSRRRLQGFVRERCPSEPPPHTMLQRRMSRGFSGTLTRHCSSPGWLRWLPIRDP